MAVYSITYDLGRPGQDYSDLITAIKSYGTYAKIQLSAWMVETPKSAKQVRDHIIQYLDANDKLMVAKQLGTDPIASSTSG